MILCFSALVHFGALRGQGREPLGWLLKLATLLYLGVWSWVIVAYHAWLGATSPELILALPKPTAILVYVFWPVSMLYVALFVLGFRRWVLTDEEEARYEELVRQAREREGR